MTVKKWVNSRVRCEKLLMEAIENNILRNALALGEFAAGDFDVAGKFGSVEELV